MFPNARHIVALAMLASLAVSASAAGNVAGAPAGWRVTSYRSLEKNDAFLADTQLFMVSPSGAYLVGQNTKGQVCATTPATYPAAHCSTGAVQGAIFPDDATWSPDGIHVAFTENWAEAFVGQVWIFDAASAALRKIAGSNKAGPGAPVDVDVQATWSPDGKEVLFERVTAKRSALYRVPAQGGHPVLVPGIHLPPGVPFESGIQWRGNTIIYNVAGVAPHGPGLAADDGIWIADAPGGRAHRVLGYSKYDNLNAMYALADVSSDGERALIFYPHIFGSITTKRADYALLDLRTGVLTPLKPAVPPGWDRVAGPLAAGFSPDGREVLYVYNALRSRGNDLRQWLAIRSLVTGAEQRVDISALMHASSLGPFILASSVTGRGAVWARNGTVLLPSYGVGAVLVTLQAS